MNKMPEESYNVSNATDGEAGGELDRAACCFTGHRDLPATDVVRLSATLRRYVRGLRERRGIRRFYAGGALGFDTFAAQAVLELRESGLDVELCLVLPCRDQDKRWSARDRAVYAEILSAADSVEYVSEHYTPWCMHARNRALVDRSSVCIAYHAHSGGGTDYTVRYARSHSVEVFNVAPRLPDCADN